MSQMRIRVDDPDARDRLAAALTATGCDALHVGSTLEIRRQEDAGTLAELRFFLRAWRAANPKVELELVG
jgi:hypothetical protein